MICETPFDAVQEARLPFSHEMNPRVPVWCVRDEFSVHRRVTHLPLLHPFPAVRVAENNLDTLPDGRPQTGSTRVRIYDIPPSARKEVSEKVAKDFDSAFVRREGF